MNVDPKIKRGRKYEDVLAGARTVFLNNGFEGASVDDIARNAGVSKATLYSYFEDKRLLFLEVARREIARITSNAIERVDVKAPPAVVLDTAARTIVTFNTSAMGIALFRLCVAESERFPELGTAYYDTGPTTARDNLAEYFRMAIGQGELKMDDPDFAAEQFLALCRSDIQMQLLMGVTKAPDAARIDRVVTEAVALFLARYLAS